MKRIVCLIYVCVSLFAKAQKPIGSLPLSITNNRTTFLLFPFQILHVDRGTQDILIEQVSSAKNMLMVKAAFSQFSNTNLTVITEDGGVYSFDVRYDSVPINTVFRYSVQSLNSTYQVPGQAMNIQDLDLYSKMILHKKKTIEGMKDNRWDMQARVKGIFIKDEAIFFQLCLKNSSAISYNPESIRFYVRDKKRSKRTASQEVELKPVYNYGNIDTVLAYQQKNSVFAFEKFTIPEAKDLIIEVMEKNGGRNLMLKINDKKIIKAQILPNLENN